MPEQVINNLDELMRSLFGASLHEPVVAVTNEIKGRREKNQVCIFSKAMQMIQAKDIDLQKIPLKVLAPLLEGCACEEDETLQHKWACLVVYMLSGRGSLLFLQQAIRVLGSMLPDDALIIELLYEILERSRIPPLPDTIRRDAVGFYPFQMGDIARELKIPQRYFDFCISNLVALGLLQWETAIVVEAKKVSVDEYDLRVDASAYVQNKNSIVFTDFGDELAKAFKASGDRD